MGFVKEFKEFALKGNVIDLAVGLIIGLYFGAIVKSLVDDIIMPVIGLLLGGVDLSNRFVVLREGATPLLGNETVAQARAAGAVVVGYGQLLNTILTFFLVAVAVFLLVKQMNRLRRLKKTEPIEPTEKACPFCFSKIPAKATRCAHCTSELGAGAASRA